VPPALAKRACRRVFSATRVHADWLCGGNAHGYHRVTGADSAYAGGRRGKERAASLRAQQ